ncbi:hypothetical protein [Mesobacterium pallidum]|uniref:hypothetical protein n=1 Tax=Mesobacterium pallidum TaxID=2872037 RepID=UPI001EE317FB|nr:hypothetical protein [Mesobacterium pallidum]
MTKYLFNPEKLPMLLVINPTSGIQIDLEDCRMEAFRIMHYTIGSRAVAKAIAEEKVRKLKLPWRKLDGFEKGNQLQKLMYNYVEVEVQRVLLLLAINIRNLDDAALQENRAGPMVGIGRRAEERIEKIKEELRVISRTRSGFIASGVEGEGGSCRTVTLSLREVCNKVIHVEDMHFHGSSESAVETDLVGVGFISQYVHLTGSRNSIPWNVSLDLLNFLSCACAYFDKYEELQAIWNRNNPFRSK